MKSINYYAYTGLEERVPLGQYASLFTTGVSGLDGPLTAGKSVTINVGLKLDNSVYTLIAKSGENELYPKIESAWKYSGPNDQGQVIENDTSITITWPESDITLDVGFRAFQGRGYIFGWDSATISEIMTDHEAQVTEAGSYYVEDYFLVTPKNPSPGVSVYYATVENGVIEENSVPISADAGSVEIPASQPIFYVYAK